MSQNHDICYHLHNVGSITGLEALKLYGCMCLAERIRDLRNEGYNIETTIIEVGRKRFASYSLKKEIVNA